MWGGRPCGQGGLILRTGTRRQNRRPKAPNRPPTPRIARPRAPPSRPATPARAWGGGARAKASYSSPTCAYGPPTQRLRPTSTPPPPTARASRARPRGARRSPWRPCAAQLGPRAPSGLQRALTGATGHLRAPMPHLRPSWLTKAAANPPAPLLERARAQRAPPALRPVLPGTRRRKRRRGPFGPWVEKSSRIAPSRRRSSRENPFARGAAQADRDLHLQHLSAISARPGTCPSAEICARSGGSAERVRRDGAGNST